MWFSVGWRIWRWEYFFFVLLFLLIPSRNAFCLFFKSREKFVRNFNKTLKVEMIFFLLLFFPEFVRICNLLSKINWRAHKINFIFRESKYYIFWNARFVIKKIKRFRLISRGSWVNDQRDLIFSFVSNLLTVQRFLLKCHWLKVIASVKDY